MLTVIRYFWFLCLLRGSPSQVPTAPWFVALVLLLNIGLSVGVSVAINDATPPLAIATAILVQQAALAGLIGVGLQLRNLSNRFIATFTAWMGCDLLITCLYAVALPVLQNLSETAPTSAIFAFFIWSMAACGNIVRHAFNISTPLGVIIAIGMTIMATIVSQAALTG